MEIPDNMRKKTGTLTNGLWCALPLCVLGACLPAAAQGPTVLAVVSAANSVATDPVVPGSIASIYGTGLATVTMGAKSTPLPLNLGGVTVTFDGVMAPLFFVSSLQVNVQVPYGLAGDSSSVVVTVNGIDSSAFVAALGPAAPGVFTVNSTGRGTGAITVYDGTTGALKGQVGPNNPALPGDTLSIFATGLGAVTNPPGAGSPAGTSPLSQSVLPVTVKLGGVDCGPPSFAGLAPFFVGLYQINVKVPASAPGGSVALRLTAGSRISNAVTPAAQVNIQAGTPGPPAQLTSLSATSGAPATRLTVTGSGFDPLVPALLNFSDSKSYSVTVRATQVTATSVTGLVPPYSSGNGPQFGSGTVSVSVNQTLAGQVVTSNSLGGFQIQALPVLQQLSGGKLTANTLLGVDQNTQETMGWLRFAALGNTGSNERVSMELGGFSTDTLVLAGLAQVASKSGTAQPLGNIDGNQVNFDATTMAAMDQLIAAVIVQDAGSCRPPVLLELQDLIQTGSDKSPATPYEQQWQSCVSSGLVPANFGGVLERGVAWSALLMSLGPSFGPAPLVAGLALSNVYTLMAAQGVGASLAGGSNPSSQTAAVLSAIEQQWATVATHTINGNLTDLVGSAAGRVQPTNSGNLSVWAGALQGATPDGAALVERLGLPAVVLGGSGPSLGAVQAVASFNVSGSAGGANIGTVTLGAAVGGGSLPGPTSRAAPAAMPFRPTPLATSSTATASLSSAVAADSSFLVVVPSAQVGQALPAQATLQVTSPDLATANLTVDLTHGTQVAPSVSLPPRTQSTLRGNFTGSGTDPNCGAVTDSGSLTAMVQPELSSLATAGGSFSGTFTLAGSTTCSGQTLSVSGSGTISGSVRAGGAVSFTFTGTAVDGHGHGGAFSGSGSGTPTALTGSFSTPGQTGGETVSVSLTLSSESTVSNLVGNFTGSGTDPHCGATTFGGSLSATVQPSLSSLATSGGSFSGTLTGTGSGTCSGLILGDTESGTISGTVSPGGAASLTFTLTTVDAHGNSGTATGSGIGTFIALTGGFTFSDPQGAKGAGIFSLANR